MFIERHTRVFSAPAVKKGGGVKTMDEELFSIKTKSQSH